MQNLMSNPIRAINVFIQYATYGPITVLQHRIVSFHENYGDFKASKFNQIFTVAILLVIVIPWFVRMYEEIIYELQLVDYLPPQEDKPR